MTKEALIEIINDLLKDMDEMELRYIWNEIIKIKQRISDKTQ